MPSAPPSGFAIRAPSASDVDRLGQLYFDCRVPGADLASIAEAIDETRAFFRGDFGEFWAEASGVIETGGRLIAALLSVHRAHGTTPRTARSSPICTPTRHSVAADSLGHLSPGACTCPAPPRDRWSRSASTAIISRPCGYTKALASSHSPVGRHKARHAADMRRDRK